MGPKDRTSVRPMVQTSPRALTLAQFLQQPEAKPANEYANGQCWQKPMPQGSHSRIQQKLAAAIDAAVAEQRIALALPELRCTFGDRSLVLDIAVFRWQRLPLQPNGTLAERFEIPPDWVVEILSPGQSYTRVLGNLLHCLQHGTELGWLIHPEERSLVVYRNECLPMVFEYSADFLPVLPGCEDLQLSTAVIFDWLQVKLG